MTTPLPALLFWAQSRGWLRSGLLRTESETSRTLLAAHTLEVTHIQTGTVLFTVPTITPCEVGAAGTPHTRLALFLLQQPDQWQPYFSTLPSDFSRFPLYRPEIAEVELQGSPTLTKLQSRRAAMEREWVDLGSSDSCPSFQAFLEARLLVSSRTFSVRIAGITQPCLAPLADMLNHSLSPNVAWRQFGSQIEIYCCRNIDSDEELTLSYGEKSNSALLSNYGFVLGSNPFDEYALTLTMPVSVKGYEVKKKLLEDRCSRLFSVPVSLKEKTLNPILGFTRFMLLQDMKKLTEICELAQDPDVGGFDPTRVPMISLVNEIAALRYIQEQAQACRREVSGAKKTGLAADCQVVMQGEQAALQGLLLFIEKALAVVDTETRVCDVPQSLQAYYSALAYLVATGV